MGSHHPSWVAHGTKAKTPDEESAYDSYMNPEPGYRSGPGDSLDAD